MSEKRRGTLKPYGRSPGTSPRSLPGWDALSAQMADLELSQDEDMYIDIEGMSDSEEISPDVSEFIESDHPLSPVVEALFQLGSPVPSPQLGSSPPPTRPGMIPSHIPPLSL